jgi:hypothetical protein
MKHLAKRRQFSFHGEELKMFAFKQCFTASKNVALDSSGDNVAANVLWNHGRFATFNILK